MTTERERESYMRREVCPVTIVQPWSAEELLAMQIDTGRRKQFRPEKKNFKETFPPLFSRALL